ncbi:MAG: SurA N-terminal domain-containing protein [Bacteroidia bacterium]|nr:SurA N-terminal domain-containing protein [Bacteroidia bacterium]
MDKEKNGQKVEPKKERVSVLEKIRRRTGLLVGIVGLALMIFILESLLGSGASLFGNDEMSAAGRINGKKIDRNEFIMKYENQLNNYRARNGGKEADEATRTQAIEGLWQQYIVELVMMPQFREIGIEVGEDELYESVVANPNSVIIQNLSDPNTGKLNEQFALPDGTLDKAKWKQAVQTVTGDNEMAVKNMEDQVKSNRYFEKFRALINKGLYVTKAEAEKNFKSRITNLTASYVVKRFESIPDSTVKLSDSDIEKYYTENAYKFKNPETTRSIEYVSFNVNPSPEDMAAIEKDAVRTANDFKALPISEDSAFVAQETENGNVVMENLTKKTMIVRDSSIYTAAPGTVFGPYNEGAYYKIYKLEAVNSVADSTRVRHILISTVDPQTQQPIRAKDRAKAMADSVVTLIKEKKATFDTLVKLMSEDKGSIEKGGDYGWWDENANWVPTFKNFGLTKPKGELGIVESVFGYHVMEVLDVSKTRHPSYKVAQIFKPIAPSDETNQRIFAEANQFAGEHNTAESFDKGVDEKKLVKRLAEGIKDGDYQINGLGSAKEVSKWAYTANKGDINIFTLADKHVVVKLNSIKNKGVLPLEEVKEAVTALAINEKKAAMFKEEFEKAGSGDIQSIAAKMNIPVEKAPDLMYENRVVPGLGDDPIFMGTAFGTKKGAKSKPTAGTTGVFIVSVESENQRPETMDLARERRQIEQELSARVDYDAFNALKNLADIEFHKSRID